MEFSAQQIAHILNGKIEGNAEVKVSNFSKIEEGQFGTLTFLANLKYAHYIYETQASIALVNDDFKQEKSLPTTLTLIRVSNAYAALAQLLELVSQSKPRKHGIEAMSFISPSAQVPKENVYIGAFTYIGENVRLGENVAIYPNSYIGDNVVIENDTTIYAGVKIYADCKIGKNCIIHSGAVIGPDGFGFAKEGDSFKKIPQLGNVIIEDDVEIGANTTIDRAVMESTIIRQGVKLDNLIQVAHNVEIGKNTVMAAQSGIAGSSKIGENCIFGGQSAVIGHLKIGNNVSVGGQSGVANNIKDGKTILGSPAIEARDSLRSSVTFPKLPDMYKQLNQLQKEIESLKEALGVIKK